MNLKERTPGEREAYLQGYRAAVEHAARVADEYGEGIGNVGDRIRALAPAPSAAPATDAEVRAFLIAEGIDPDAAVERMRARVKAITGRDLPSASGGDEARCEHDIPLTMRCAWCEHAEARRSSPTDVTNVGCERCGGTGLVYTFSPGGQTIGMGPCPVCGGRGTR